MTKLSRLFFFVVVLLSISLVIPFSSAQPRIVSHPSSKPWQTTIGVTGFDVSTTVVDISIILSDPTLVQNPEFPPNFDFASFATKFLSTAPTVSLVESGRDPVAIESGWEVTDGKQQLNVMNPVSLDAEIQIMFEFLLPTLVTMSVRETPSEKTYKWSSQYAFVNFPSLNSYLRPSLICSGSKASQSAEFVFNFLPFDFGIPLCLLFEIQDGSGPFPPNTVISVETESLENAFQSLIDNLRQQATICFKLPVVPVPTIFPSLTIKFEFIGTVNNPFLFARTTITNIMQREGSGVPNTFDLEFVESVSPLVNDLTNSVNTIRVELVEISTNLEQIANFFTPDTESTKPNWIRWSLKIFPAAGSFSAELSYTFPYLLSMESIIVYCLPAVPGQIIATPTGSQKFLLDFVLDEPAVLHCYGSVSPFDQYRDDLRSARGFSSPYIVDFKLDDANSARRDDYTGFFPQNPQEFANIQMTYNELPWIVNSKNLPSKPKIFRQIQITVSGRGYFNSNQVQLHFSNTASVSTLSNNVSHIFSTYKLPDYLDVNASQIDTTDQIPVVKTNEHLVCLVSADEENRSLLVLKCDLPIYHQMNPELNVIFSIPIEEFFNISFSLVKFLPYDTTSINLPRTSLQLFQTPKKNLLIDPTQPKMFFYPSIPTSLSSSFNLSQQIDRTLPKFDSAIFRVKKPKTTPYINFNFLFETTAAINTNTITVFLYYFDSSSATSLLLPNGQGTPIPVSKNGMPVKLDLSPEEIQIFQNKPLFALIEYASTPGSTTYFSSEFFTLEIPCAKPPLLTLPNNFSDASKWITSCSNGGICDRSGYCICKNSFTGPKCEIQPCSTCVHKASCTTSSQFNNQPNAIPGGKCVCSSSWNGDVCDIPTLCSTISSTQCLNGGQLTELTSTTPPTCDISKPCKCLDSWAPPTCANCYLTCDNGGVVKAKHCSICMCRAGFIGTSCSCRGLNASLTINGYNESIVQYFIALQQNPTTIPADLFQRFEFILSSLLEVISNLLSVDNHSILHFEPSIITTPSQSDSIPATTSTTLKFQIYFNCPEYNPNLFQDAIYNQFRTVLLTQFLTDPTVKDLFVFNVFQDDQPLDGEITPTEATDIEDPNSENSSFSLSFGCAIISLLFVFFFDSYVI